MTHFDIINVLLIVINILVPIPLYYNSYDLVLEKDHWFSDVDILNFICWSGSYWILVLITLIALVFIASLAVYRAQNRILKKKEIGFGLTESDILVDFTAMVRISLYSFIGGIFSTFLGITNFIVYSEMLEKTGKTTIEANVTAIALIALGSFSSSIEYFMRASITLEYAIWLVVITSISLAICAYLKIKFKPNMRRPSIVSYIAYGEISILMLLLLATRILRITKEDFRRYYFERDT